MHVDCESKSDTGNKRGDWNHFKITQTIPDQIPGKHEIKELQKTAILGTAHILCKVLMYKFKINFTGEITFPVAQIVDTE